ncbi:MAG: hypothetical protein ACLUHE_08110 [Christensenellales bacterium]
MMIPEKRFLNQIQQVLARLMQPLWLLDTEGTVLLPEENRSKINLPEFMEPGMPVAFEGKTFLMIGITPELILCADAQGAATHDCIVLAGAMVQSMGRGEGADSEPLRCVSPRAARGAGRFGAGSAGARAPDRDEP